MLTRNRIHKTTQNFEVALQSDLSAIRGNRQRMEQVVVNLINNACGALTGPDGYIRIRTVLNGGAHVCLKVEDSGAGIPEAELRQVLDPFFTTKRDSGGTGLGLSISDGIVRDHGGRMDFASVPGAGTTVTVEFNTAMGHTRLECAG